MAEWLLHDADKHWLPVLWLRKLHTPEEVAAKQPQAWDEQHACSCSHMPHLAARRPFCLVTCKWCSPISWLVCCSCCAACRPAFFEQTMTAVRCVLKMSPCRLTHVCPVAKRPRSAHQFEKDLKLVASMQHHALLILCYLQPAYPVRWSNATVAMNPHGPAFGHTIEPPKAFPPG